MTKKTAPYSLRLPASTMDWVTISAQKNQRSVSSEIIFKLHHSVGRQFSAQKIKAFKKRSPTKLNDQVFQFRINESLKEALKMYAKTNGNSFNQEIVMRLFYELSEARDSKPAKVIEMFGIKEKEMLSHEEIAILKSINLLSKKNKHAVMTLIRNLTG